MNRKAYDAEAGPSNECIPLLFGKKHTDSSATGDSRLSVKQDEGRVLALRKSIICTQHKPPEHTPPRSQTDKLESTPSAHILFLKEEE